MGRLRALAPTARSDIKRFVINYEKAHWVDGSLIFRGKDFIMFLSIGYYAE